MNKDQLYSAMDKINASEEFKIKVKCYMEGYAGKNQTTKYLKLASVFVIFIVVFAIGAFYLPSINNNLNKPSDTSKFQITGDLQGAEACYISVVYLYGYAYSPSEWLSYSRGHKREEQIFEAGDKLGEVTLDLKGLTYTGTPPDFSSTRDVGTEIYEIKNVKKERAILVKLNNEDMIFYRTNKALLNISEPIGLTIAEVFQMMTDHTEVTAVELRNEEDGSWMRTSENSELLSLINKELPEQPLFSEEIYQELNSYRVPVNLMFEDGAALHIQFYPEQQYASVFGGYIKISKELAEKIIQLNSEGEIYDKMNDILPIDLTICSYLYFKNHVDGSEVLCKEPAWSGGALNDTLKYYRTVKTDQGKAKQLVMTLKAVSSESDYSEVLFYEDEIKNIIIKVNGEYYETLMGHMSYEDLVDYLMNYTL